MTEAQKRATAKYRKNNVKGIKLSFYPKDEELYQFCHNLGSTKIKEILEDVRQRNKG